MKPCRSICLSNLCQRLAWPALICDNLSVGSLNWCKLMLNTRRGGGFRKFTEIDHEICSFNENKRRCKKLRSFVLAYIQKIALTEDFWVRWWRLLYILRSFNPIIGCHLWMVCKQLPWKFFMLYLLLWSQLYRLFDLTVNLFHQIDKHPV